MPKSNIPRDPKVYLLMLALFAVLLVTIPRSGRFSYDYKKGSPWSYETLVATFDFPVLKTNEQIQAEKEANASHIVPYYKYSEEQVQEAKQAVNSVDIKDEKMQTAILSAFDNIYEKGVLDDNENAASWSSDDIIYVQKDKSAKLYPANDIYSVSSARAKLLSDLSKLSPKADSLLSASGIYSNIVPNVFFDKETTDLVHSQSAGQSHVSLTSGFVSTGTTIVSKGEVVTSEIQQVLDSYKVEYDSNYAYLGNLLKFWIGNILIALTFVVILFFSIFFICPEAFGQMNRLLYLVFIVALTACAILLTCKLETRILYLIPFSLVSLFLIAFFRKRVVLPVYVVSLLPLLIFSQNGIELFMIHLAGGITSMFVFERFNKGWLQFVTAMISFVVVSIVFFGFRCIYDIKGLEEIDKLLNLFLGSMLSVAGYPLIYLFERVFMLVSSSRLVELADTNNSILLDLAKKAPGTFQHSLQVMNLSEAAARSIDANVPLVRAGALYHDIGKINNPQCFVENQTMVTNFHESLSPEESAKEIISHVDDGIAIAQKHGLPNVIIDIINSHHGTTRTEYFYNKYVNDGGDPQNTESFTYHGNKPTTKEQVIVMLCDTLEAASRTLKDNKPETFNTFVEGIVDAKIKAGQLEDADISLRELGTVKSVIKEYLRQIYHDRIVYPKRNR